MSSKFFRFTVTGDDLDTESIRQKLAIDCDTYQKGETVVKNFMTEHRIEQKTNRVVYSSVADGKARLDGFLTKNLRLIASKISVLEKYLRKNMCRMELTVYAGNKTDIVLNKTQIDLIQKIGVGLEIHFC